MSAGPGSSLARRAATALEGVLARRPAGRARIGSPAGRARIGSPAGRARIGSPAGTHRPDDVTFLIWNIHAMGATVRTVLRQAEAFADLGRQVTIVSVVRHAYQEEPFFPIDPRCDVEVLVDRHRMHRARGPFAAGGRWLDRRPAPGTQISIGREAQASLLTEIRVVRRVMRSRGTVFATRVGLNLALARYGHPAALRVAEEHLELRRYADTVQRAMRRHLRKVDVVACLTEADARSYRKALGANGPLVAVVPNAIPDALPAPADPSIRRLVAVGRIEPVKGFDLLVDAFAEVADDHPDWILRIVGDGRRRDELVATIARHGLEDRVELRPGTPDVQSELASASVYVLSSRFEAFGMVLLEAMATGLAVVSFACRQGPREFLAPERNALLAPPKDVPALASQLARVMDDETLRTDLGAAARQDVEAFTVARVTARWIEVLDAAASRREQHARQIRAAGRVVPVGPVGRP